MPFVVCYMEGLANDTKAMMQNNARVSVKQIEADQNADASMLGQLH